MTYKEAMTTMISIPRILDITRGADAVNPHYNWFGTPVRRFIEYVWRAYQGYHRRNVILSKSPPNTRERRQSQ